MKIKKYLKEQVKNVEQATQFLEDLQPTWSGRRIKKKGLSGTLKLKHIVAHTQQILTDSVNEAEKASSFQVQFLFNRIKDLKRNLNKKNKYKNNIVKLFAKVRQVANLFHYEETELPKNGAGGMIRPPVPLTPLPRRFCDKETQRSEVEAGSIVQPPVPLIPSGSLIQRINDIHSFTIPDILGNPAFNNFSRRVQIGVDSRGNKLLFFKVPTGKHAYVQIKAMKREEFAFLISEKFKMNVVPLTKIIDIDQLPVNSVFNDSGLRQFSRFSNTNRIIVQEAVLLAKCQIHLEETTDNSKLKKLKIQQVHQAIIFNMLLGRHDGRPINTVIDTQNQLMEVDNEFIGQKTTDSWLLEQDVFKKTILSKEIVNDFIAHDQTIIIQLFEEMSQRSIPLEKTKRENILYNFDKLHAFFSKSKDQDISVADLDRINQLSKEESVD